jgi:hypothetical protein
LILSSLTICQLDWKTVNWIGKLTYLVLLNNIFLKIYLFIDILNDSSLLCCFLLNWFWDLLISPFLLNHFLLVLFVLLFILKILLHLKQNLLGHNSFLNASYFLVQLVVQHKVSISPICLSLPTGQSEPYQILTDSLNVCLSFLT